MATTGHETETINVAGLKASLQKFKTDMVDTKQNASTAVTGVAYDATNKKITKTVNTTTSDVVTVATLKTDMALNNVTNDAQVKRSEMGAASGVATLDENGLVPSSQLPSYVDDVIELLDMTDTAPAHCVKGDLYFNTSTKKIVRATGTDTWGTGPTTNTDPESGKIYVNLTDMKEYRWGGTAMAEISKSLVIGTTTGTAADGKVVADHTADTTAHVTAVEKSTWNGKIGRTIETTWADLKGARDGGTLIPGQWYRITDFVTTTALENTQSAGHQFDIILRADASNKLNENAYAALHNGDTYFSTAGAKLEAWELRYCIDNDTDRFEWVDATNGKGVIYYMKDEWGNECSYDFKNMMFARYQAEISNNKLALINCSDWYQNEGEDTYAAACDSSYRVLSGQTAESFFYVLPENVQSMEDFDHDQYSWAIEEGFIDQDGLFVELSSNDDYGAQVMAKVTETVRYFFTFTKNESFANHIIAQSAIKDASLSKTVSRNIIKTDGLSDNVFIANTCRGNTFGNNSKSNTFGNNCNSNTFGNDCYSNTFGNGCYSNTFGKTCYANTFGNDCFFNTFGNNCFFNTFGNNSKSNIFGNDCFFNTFGDDCYYNTFGNSCSSNIFGNGCYYNTFGNSFYSNTFGNNCISNIFGSDCYSNIFGNSCYYNTFGNGCFSNIFGNSCSSNIFGNGCNYNTFGNSCYYNTFGVTCSHIRFQKDYMYYNIVENGNNYINITSTQTTSSSNVLRNITIAQGVNNTNTTKTISHNTLNDTFKTTYQPVGSKVVSV